MDKSRDTREMMEDKFLTPSEAAALAKVSLATVRRWLGSGKIRGWIPTYDVTGVRQMSEDWLVHRDDLLAYMRHLSEHPGVRESLRQWIEALTSAGNEFVQNLLPVSLIRRLLFSVLIIVVLIVIFVSLRDTVDFTGIPSPASEYPVNAVVLIDRAPSTYPYYYSPYYPSPGYNYLHMRTLYSLTLSHIADAEELARAGIGPVVLSADNEEQMSAYRRQLGIPTDFLPGARNLVLLDIGKLEINGPDRMAWGETRVFTATLTLDEALAVSEYSTLSAIATSSGVRISRILHARLAGEAFNINPPEDDTQPQMALDRELHWTWEVKAKYFGQGRLFGRILGVALDIGPSANSESILVALESSAKYVQVTLSPDWGGILSIDFVQQIVVSVIGSSVIAALVTAFLISRRKDNELRQIGEKLDHLAEKVRDLSMGGREAEEAKKEDEGISIK